MAVDPDWTEMKVDIGVIKATLTDISSRLLTLDEKMVSRHEHEALKDRVSKLESFQTWTIRTIGALVIAAVVGLVVVKPTSAQPIDVVLYRDKEWMEHRP